MLRGEQGVIKHTLCHLPCWQDWASCLLEQVSQIDLEQAVASGGGRRRSLQPGLGTGTTINSSSRRGAAEPAVAAQQDADVQQLPDVSGASEGS